MEQNSWKIKIISENLTKYIFSLLHRENQTKLTTSLTNPIVDGGVEKRYNFFKSLFWFLKEQVYLKYNESY